MNAERRRPERAAAGLYLENLNVRFSTAAGEVHAVRDLTLAVAPGECLGVVGESGAGKSQTFLAALGLLSHNGRASGCARLGSLDLLGLSERELDRVRGASIGLVFQDPMTSLTPHLRIGDQIAEPLRRHLGLSARAAAERALALLSRVHVTDAERRMQQYPHELSGGMRQRVMIAIAIACEPAVLVADEPTTSLDVTIQAQILSLLSELKRSRGMSMVLITHDMGAVAGVADRVAVMRSGEVVEVDTVQAVFKRARHEYTRALLAAVPRIDVVPAAVGSAASDGAVARGSAASDGAVARGSAASDGAVARGEVASDGAMVRGEVASLGPMARGEVASRGPMARGGRTALSVGALVSGDGASAAGDGASALGDGASVARDRGSAHSGGPPTSKGLALALDDVRVEFPLRGGWLAQRGALRALDGVSLELAAGEAVGVVGESGSGKTTLARAALQLLRIGAGRVVWLGRTVEALPQRELRPLRRDLQIIFQDPLASLDPRMTVEEIIAEPLQVHQPELTPDARRAAVAKALSRAHLEPTLAGRYPHELSGGQCQRVGIARAMILEPRVLVCDEAVSALDATVQQQIVSLLAELKRESGLGILFISHNLAVVRQLCERILVLYLGRMIELAPAEAIYSQPLHPYTRELLDCAPIPDPDVQPARLARALFGEPPSPVSAPSGCVYRTRCPHAVAVCQERIPEWGTAEGPERRVACHRWRELAAGPKREP